MEKNFHVPLPVRVYEILKQEAQRQKRPATQLVREAIVHSLQEFQKQRTEQTLRDYVTATAGTAYDLDEGLEHASSLHLAETTTWK